MCRKATNVGWSTHGHTGGDVPLFAYGPGRPVGLLDGPRIGTLTVQAVQRILDRSDPLPPVSVKR